MGGRRWVRRDSLNGQIKRVCIVRIDSVEIDRRTNYFGGTRLDGVKNKDAVIGWQANHCPARVVRNAHNVKIAATVLKKLLNRRIVA